MLRNPTQPPFKRARNRQDFKQTLFVTGEGSQSIQMTFKLALSTNLGYFELQNDYLKRHSDPLATRSPPECAPQSNDEHVL